MANETHGGWSPRIRRLALTVLCCMTSGVANHADVAWAQEAKPAGGGLVQGAEKADPKPAPPPRQWPKQVDIQLGKGLDADPNLRLVGQDAATMARTGPQGLRLTLAADRDRLDEVGIEAQKTIRGDFEITLSYELLAVPIPGPPGGAGAVLEARFDTPDSPKVRFGRTQKGNGAYFGSTFYIMGDDGKNTSHGLKYPRADEKIRTGRMRFVRTGNDLAFQAEEGAAGFRTIATKEVGGADVASVRALATSGWKPLLVDLRFTNLEIRWDPGTKVGAAANPAADEQRPRGPGLRGWLVAAGIVGMLVALAIAGALFLVLRRPGPAKDQAQQAPRKKSGDVPSPFTVQCPGCQRKIRLRTDQAGKKVKCPHCAGAIEVPSLEARVRSPDADAES